MSAGGAVLSDEQQLLRATCRRIVGREAPVVAAPLRRVQPSPAAWTALTDAGLLGLHVPADRGGAGATALETALVLEELARGPLAVPYLGTVLALDLVGGCPGGAGLVDELVNGRRPGAVIFDSSLRHLARTGLALDVSEFAVAVGVAGDQVVATEVAGDAAGIDLTRSLGTVTDAGTTVLGPLTNGSHLARWECFALACLCADLVGCMAGALDGAVAHARQREQFGRVVGSFQAVQQLCAEQLVAVEASRSITWYAAWAVDALPLPEARMAARTAKAYCSEAGRRVCEAAIQIWGGLGMTWEVPAHLFLRRALLSRAVLGDEHVQLQAIADELLPVEAS